MTNDEELFKYYVDRTDNRLKSIEEKLEELIGFRWMLIGMAGVVSCIISVAIEIVARR